MSNSSRGFRLSSNIRRLDAGALDRIISSAENMALEKVKIGLPDNAGTDDEGVSLHFIGMVHEYGSYARNIPKRPFIQPTIEANQRKYAEYLKSKTMKILLRRTTLKKELSIVGEAGKADIQKYMVEGSFTALSEKTIKAKGSSEPLIDTGQMRNAITYEIVK